MTKTGEQCASFLSEPDAVNVCVAVQIFTAVDAAHCFFSTSDCVVYFLPNNRITHLISTDDARSQTTQHEYNVLSKLTSYMSEVRSTVDVRTTSPS